MQGLNVEQDFNLRSYYLDDTPSIESLVRARLGDDAPILLNGIWVPTSSFTALVHPRTSRPDPATQVLPAADPNASVAATMSASSAAAGSSPADASTPASTQASVTLEIKEEHVVMEEPVEWAAPEPEGTPLVPHEYVRVVPKKKAVKRRRSSAMAAPVNVPPTASVGTLPKLRLNLSRTSTSSPTPLIKEESRSKTKPDLAISVLPPGPSAHEPSSPLTPIATTAENASAFPSPRAVVRPLGDTQPISPASSEVMVVDDYKLSRGAGVGTGTGTSRRTGMGSPARLPLPVFPPAPEAGWPGHEGEELAGVFAAPPPKGADVLLGRATGRGRK